MHEALHILKKYWNHDSFRPAQWSIISDVLAKKDVIALLPTGGGKSVCFQIPALMQDGICIVVSPLIALMEDQINTLQNKNIKAMAITSGISYQELDQKLDNCIYGNYKFLYLSPERLQQELVQQRIKLMNVNLIAVDEAHCISQWGHDFRPAYRNILSLRELQTETPIIALTATATPPVVRDMVEELNLEEPAIHRNSFFRENLSYNVIRTEDKFHKITRLLQNKEDTAIIYVRNRNATIEISEFLNKLGYKAGAYHGGLKMETRAKRLQDWMQNHINIMVATTAFGMGIDKPDVRQVIHLNLPESIESYFQEAGRAGRDGQPATSTIITNDSDIPVLRNQFLVNLPDANDAKFIYKKLNSYFRIAYGEGENETFNFNFSKFCEQYALNASKTYNTLQLLDRCSVLKLSQQFRKKTEIQFIISGNQVSNFINDNIKYEVLVKALLRTYGGIFENAAAVNLSAICKKAGIAENAAVEMLEQLEKGEIISFNYAQQDTSITFLVPREDDSTINPLIQYIKLQNTSKKEKIEAILSYIVNDKECRSKQLLKYFGEEEVADCGICSVCTTKTSDLSRDEMNEIYKKIMRLIKDGERDSRYLVDNIGHQEAHILWVLRLLTERKIISRSQTNKYKIYEG